MADTLVTGTTDVTRQVVMRDATTKAPKADVAVTGIDLYYQELGAAQSAKADVTALDAADSAHADNKAYHCGNAVYRVDWPDAAFDGGAGKIVDLIYVCAGCETVYERIHLVSATRGLSGTALPNAAADAAGGLPISDAGGLDLDTYIKRLEAAFTSTIAGYIDAAISSRSDGTGVTLHSDYDAAKTAAQAGNAMTLADDAITAAKFDQSTAYPLASSDGSDLTACATATGFSTHSAADVVTALGTGSTLTDCATATGFSTHSAADVVTALGTGSTLTDCATATGFSTLDAAGVRTAVGMASADLDTQLAALPTAAENADALIGRNIAGGSSTGRLIKDVFRLLRNKVSISSGTMTVCEEDDSTPAWTATVTGTAGAAPVTTVDPA